MHHVALIRSVHHAVVDHNAATVYHALGIDPDTRIGDPLGRPQSVALGRPIVEVLG